MVSTEKHFLLLPASQLTSCSIFPLEPAFYTKGLMFPCEGSAGWNDLMFHTRTAATSVQTHLKDRMTEESLVTIT